MSKATAICVFIFMVVLAAVIFLFIHYGLWRDRKTYFVCTQVTETKQECHWEKRWE